jgi:hypothetical protein
MNRYFMLQLFDDIDKHTTTIMLLVFPRMFLSMLTNGTYEWIRMEMTVNINSHYVLNYFATCLPFARD